MQTQGSLAEADLADLLRTLQSERATGTLTVEGSDSRCNLYFLFGHLFHAANGNQVGEPVVLDAFGWSSGSYVFDPRAKLPAEETIKISPAELIAKAEGGSTPEEAEVAPATPSFASFAPEPVVEESAVSEPVLATAAVATAPERNPETVPSWSMTSSVDEAPATPAASPSTSRNARAAVTKAATGTAGQVVVAPLPAPLPLPAGKAVYEGLKAAFVDFPRLLKTLRGDVHTGYVRLNAGDYAGVLLLDGGQLVNASVTTGGEVSYGEAAFMAFRRQMDSGEGKLDVVELSSEVVNGLDGVLAGPTVFTGLLGRFVNFASLLEHAEEEVGEGSLIVVTADNIGFILLHQGKVLAAYTKTSPTLVSEAQMVSALAGQRDARIEVKSGHVNTAGIDVEAALARAY